MARRRKKRRRPLEMSERVVVNENVPDNRAHLIGARGEVVGTWDRGYYVQFDEPKGIRMEEQAYLRRELTPEEDWDKPAPNIAGEVDSSGARELVLFIVNDGDLYRQQHIPIIKNLVTKMARGTYDSEKAVKLFMYLAESGAKKYVKEFGSGPPRGLKWHEMFNVATRREVAKSLRDSFETEAELGNYDHLLPKKYQR